ncbi:MAG: hypothetical protein HUK20_10640 [Fibrobacter sp.]|nr:hypothetical protein [Fibrobacter sp.]
MKKFSSALAFVLGAFVSFSSAAQIQGFVSGYAPGNVDEKRESHGTTKLHSDFMWGLGAEFLANPAGPLIVGGGLGFFSVQKDGGDIVVMPSVPLWASIGVIGPDNWAVRPYVEARFGYPIPAARFATWWDKPMNLFATGVVGAQLPYHMGVEFDCTYLTMDKYFKKYDQNFHLNSIKVGGSITVHFDLFNSSNEYKKEDFAYQPSADDFASADNSSSVNDAADSSASEEKTYSDYYSDLPTEETSSDGTAVDSASTENSYESLPLEEPTDSSTVESDPLAEDGAAGNDAAEGALADTTSAEDVASNESAVEETPAEAPVEEAVAEETTEEKVVEEPAPEPVVKKTPSKAKKNKKKAKKSSKKSKKKTTKKKK